MSVADENAPQSTITPGEIIKRTPGEDDAYRAWTPFLSDFTTVHQSCGGWVIMDSAGKWGAAFTTWAELEAWIAKQTRPADGPSVPAVDVPSTAELR